MRNGDKKKKVNILVIIELILGLAIVIGIFVAVCYFVFPLKKVEVEGTDLYSDKEITNYILDDKYCNNTMYAYLKNKIFPKHSAEFVDSFDVSIKKKDTLVIHVNEKSILGYITNDDLEYVYFNYEGKITEISKTYIDGYMEVSGVNYKSAKIGDTLSIGKSEVGYLTALIKFIKKNEMVPNRIDYDEYNNITLCYDNYNISMGSSSYLEEKIERLLYILPEIQDMSGVLHLENFSPDNTDIVFERQEERSE